MQKNESTFHLQTNRFKFGDFAIICLFLQDGTEAGVYLMKVKFIYAPAVFQYSRQHLVVNRKFSFVFGNLLPSHHTQPPLSLLPLLTVINEEGK